ncbi:MAG: prepilin peptidase [Thiomargarita sp.]|nr:prepilin peptidase [Thiomargarita sp.]
MEQILNLLANEIYILIALTGILGLIVGSFLNVVIYRLPIMMKHNWHVECSELLEIPSKETDKVFNLNQPRSHCPNCKKMITVWQNIPVISYIWQRGRCVNCQQTISIRYPLIEITSALLAIIVTLHFGFGLALIGALLLVWALLVASMIDFDHMLLPDDIILPFLWLGIFCNLFGLYTDLESSVIGAIMGYLILWSVYWTFKLITKKDGMGYGDFKLLALLGAWMGWQSLPLIILISSFVGAIVGITLITLQNNNKNTPIPFGPYLATAGFIYLIWGTTLSNNYLLWFQL